MYQNSILNYDYLNLNRLDNRPENGYEYLIITVGNYLDQVQEFREWKEKKGFRTKIVDISEIGNNPFLIKQYIYDEYYNYEQALNYVLFVGDHNEINMAIWQSSYSDFWYGCVNPGGDDDFLGDIDIGRFSIDSLDDINNLINKTINYEFNPPYNEWIFKSLLIAHMEGEEFQQCKELTFPTSN